MVIANDPPQVPPDGYVDNPTEVSGYLSRFPVDLNIQDLPKIADKGGFVDDILSKELLQLSLQDRNAINEEIHGVQTLAREESPELLSQSLAKMETEISIIPNKNAYDRSQQFPHTYVNSAEFRLRFLRCELFDVKNAASKIVKFLDVVSELFGDFALRRQVQMSDLSREEMQVFRVGHQQLLPYRDRSGRRIFALVGGVGVTVPLVTRVSFSIFFKNQIGIILFMRKLKYLNLLFCLSIQNTIPTGENTDIHYSRSIG